MEDAHEDRRPTVDDSGFGTVTRSRVGVPARRVSPGRVAGSILVFAGIVLLAA